MLALPWLWIYSPNNEIEHCNFFICVPEFAKVAIYQLQRRPNPEHFKYDPDQTEPIPYFPHFNLNDFPARIEFRGRSASGFGRNCELWCMNQISYVLIIKCLSPCVCVVILFKYKRLLLSIDTHWIIEIIVKIFCLLFIVFCSPITMALAITVAQPVYSIIHDHIASSKQLLAIT